MLVEVMLVIVIGLIAGAVVNALADDLPLRRNPRLPRYVDDDKKRAIHLYPPEEAAAITAQDDEPRPVTAWLGLTAFLLGQRRSPQGHRLSWRYPLIELLTVGLMLLAYHAATTNTDIPEIHPLQFIIWLLYMAIFALIIVIDIEHKLILFVVIIPSLGIAVLDSVLKSVIGEGFYPPEIGEALLGGLLGFVVFFLLYNGGFVFTYIMGKMRGQSIEEIAFGYGDVMMATLSGVILGWRSLIFAMFITVFLGAFGALVYLISRRLVGARYSAFTALPYGPYIVIGTLLMLLYREPVIEFLLGS
ncbi:MAG: A24 family peptidase [Anaerolineae bacterium]